MTEMKDIFISKHYADSALKIINLDLL